MEFKVKFLPGEYFWGGSTAFGTEMPICEKSSFSRDFRVDAPNQTMPLFLSNKGRYVWSETAFAAEVKNGELCFDGDEFELAEAGDCLKDAYLAAMKAHFPFGGKQIPREFFKTAQYNTWMEFTYEPTQGGVLEYARNIISHGFEPGILIIDEGWHTRYGLWEFDFAKFPDPAAMVKELHEMGFIVMLWVTPLVTADGQTFTMKVMRREFNPESGDELFIRNKAGKIGIFEWWNGYSALLDFRKKCDSDFMKERLDFLMSEYGVDGFKFDGGSYLMYHPSNLINGEPRDDHDPMAMNIAWNEFGAKYKFHEYKDTFKGGGKATVQRLRDRNHRWVGDGIDTIVPSSIMQGLMGHPFICPDMIGGGEWSYRFIPGFKVDEELFVRMAQVSALFPMMQFSWAPWNALSEENLKLVTESAALHKKMSEQLIELVGNAEKTGEPVVRCLEYNFPGCGYENVKDEFMLGNDILVCPVVTKGTREKEIIFPQGKWQDEDGNVFCGEKTVKIPSPLDKLLWFKKIK